MLKRGEPVGKKLLEELYIEQGLSAQEIADKLVEDVLDTRFS